MLSSTMSQGGGEGGAGGPKKVSAGLMMGTISWSTDPGPSVAHTPPTPPPRPNRTGTLVAVVNSDVLIILLM